MVATRGGTAGRILQRARLLAEASETLQSLDTPWARHIRLANLHGSKAVVYADSAAAANLARLHAARIIACLQRRRIRCSEVEVRVRPARDFHRRSLRSDAV